MANKKKKTGQAKRPAKPRGHYCRVCGEHKANEKFSGSGHAAHICKACASKSPAEKSEGITINKLHGMAFRYLSEAEIKWLGNRRNDVRPEVSGLAKEIFEQRFPRQARNEIKARLHIKNIVFCVRGEVDDSYGDEYIVNAEFTADTSGRIVKKSFDDNGGVAEKSVDIGVKAARKFFNVMVHNYDISFWNEDLCHEISRNPDIDLLPDFSDVDEWDIENLDDEDSDGGGKTVQADGGEEATDDRVPTWSVAIKYMNGTEQSIKGYDYIPDEVIELFADFDGYFEEELPDGEYNDDELM